MTVYLPNEESAEVAVQGKEGFYTDTDGDRTPTTFDTTVELVSVSL